MGVDLIADAQAWVAQDPDPETRAELERLLTDVGAGDEGALAELSDRFTFRLEFGTAGLRGALGAGPNRMNRVLVSQAAAGLVGYLREHEERPTVVVGYDGRHNSEIFARDTAELVAGAGGRAILLPRMLPTPVLAFAVRHLGASAGVMVTASHNPARDNGYKVYLGGEDGGSQIVPPADSAIARHIERIAAEVQLGDLPRSTAYETADEQVLDEYVARTAALSGVPGVQLAVVYTAMHGVGWEVAQRVFRDAGFAEPVTVPEQLEPDPDFPTVAFPNPEEPGALDLSLARAAEVGADLVVANDPDADRLAIAIPLEAGGWRRLSGNEIGFLLGWRIAERLRSEGRTADAAFANSLVSSPALAAVAAHYGIRFEETLTGFKWISRVDGLAFGYEEALGYLVDPGKVRDKDGISAAVEFLALASELAGRGVSFEQHLRDFADRFGAFASSQISLRVEQLADIPRILRALREQPPSEIAGIPVQRIDDFAQGYGPFPPSDIVRIVLDGGARVIVRPSGTEPKVKVYIDATSSEGGADERIAAAADTVSRLDAALRERIR